jgi:hypothetical protein
MKRLITILLFVLALWAPAQALNLAEHNRLSDDQSQAKTLHPSESPETLISGIFMSE